jgi:serine/threonine protein kinase/tetratricopeptide (TPR) repeat protein
MADHAVGQDALAGQTLGHYRITQKIGAGGMGEVYCARDEHLDREVAIKVVPPGMLADEHSRKRFRKEALALSKLNHPNIATIHDFDTQQGVDFLVMEYIPGTTLSEKIGNRPLPEKEVIALGVQLAEGLFAAHERGVVHRDLKPANLRLTGDGRLKILDFGLAKLGLPVTGSAETVSLTDADAAAGTLPYMAPEQLLGAEADARTDIHAAGSVLYEMATGRRPFAELERSQLIGTILHRPPQPPTTINLRLSAELEWIIVKCLEKEPENRYQSAKELAVDLRRLQTGTHSGLQPLRRPIRRWSRKPVWWGTGILAFVLVLVIALNPGHWRSRMLGSDDVPHISSLAVLPLKNLSGDPGQEYFADGMTDELISRLARTRTFRVISRTSVVQYKGSQKTLRTIANELGVDAVVEGSVMRSGNKVRITADLIDARLDQHLWGDSYNRDVSDALELQNDVAQAISSHIGMVLADKSAPPVPPTTRKVDPRAYEAYLRGRYYWNQRTVEDLNEALRYFQEAIADDPEYAAAYSGVADSYLLLEWSSGMSSAQAFAGARAADSKALVLDPTLAEAHATRAQILLTADWNWAGAEAEFKQAISLNPSYSMAHHWYGLELGQLGRVEEAKRELELARQLDPLPAINQANVAWAYYVGRDYQTSIVMLRKVLERDPDFWLAHWGLGSAYVQTGEYTQAVAELERAVSLSKRDAGTISSLAVAQARSGRPAEARKLLSELLLLSQHERVSGADIALIYVALGEREEALGWLQKAYTARAHDLLSLNSDPWWDSLRDDPRFRQLIVQVGFPNTQAAWAN